VPKLLKRFTELLENKSDTFLRHGVYYDMLLNKLTENRNSAHGLKTTVAGLHRPFVAKRSVAL